MATIVPTAKAGTATGPWAWLNTLGQPDPEIAARTATATPVAPVAKPKPKPVSYMSEADKQRIDMGLSLFGFGAFYSDRGRKDAAGATTAVAVNPVAINGKLVKQKPGGLTTNQGIQAVTQPLAGVVIR